jgi:hypothetical protein
MDPFNMFAAVPPIGSLPSFEGARPADPLWAPFAWTRADPGQTAPRMSAMHGMPTGAPLFGELIPPERASPHEPPLGDFGDWLGRNRNALLMLGAGIAGGRTWGEAISNGLTGLARGHAADTRRPPREVTPLQMQLIAAPEGSGIRIGSQRFVKQNGRWVAQ